MRPTTLLPLQRKSCHRFLLPLKIHCSQLGLNPRTLGTMASTIAIILKRMTCDRGKWILYTLQNNFSFSGLAEWALCTTSINQVPQMASLQIDYVTMWHIKYTHKSLGFTFSNTKLHLGEYDNCNVYWNASRTQKTTSLKIRTQF
jgi:hypothetical protein